MKNLIKKSVLIAFAFGALFGYTPAVQAEPCLVVYPDINATYHYDINEYYTVTFGHPLYDPMYDRGGQVLIDINSDQIAYNIYQIPNLVGFKMSVDGKEGYFFIGSTFNLIVDGFSNQPVTYENIVLVFNPKPEGYNPTIFVDGDIVTGNTYAIGDLAVATPTPDGNNYSDTLVKNITWSGSYGIEIWAFADSDYNGIHDGGECFTAFSHDSTVPTLESTWGAVKSLYQD